MLAKMFKRLALICALIGLSVAQVDRQVNHFFTMDHSNLIETPRGYAMNSPLKDWRAVSVNDGNVQAYSANCQLTSMNRQQMPLDLQNVLAQARQEFHNQRTSTASYSLNGGAISSSSSIATNTRSMFANGISVSQFDDNNLSIAKPNGGLPGGINRVFINDDLITYAYNDGRVLMRPYVCLSSDERQQVEQLRMEAAEARRKFNMRMQQLNQNMQNMQQNLQFNMQNMQRNLQNMGQNMRRQFGGYGFPFGNSNSYGQGMGFGPGSASTFGQPGGGSWPFGQNNSPFYPVFPFGRK